MGEELSTLSPSGTVVRFGTFELDVRAGELRKAGMRIRIQQQPLQLLYILLQRPGEVVTREQLRQQLWGDGVYVDFDRSLNRAIVKLREALGDVAESPRFIETLPRVGYRFIAPVEGGSGAVESLPLAPTHERRAPWLRGLIVVSVVLFAGLSLLAVWLYRKATPGALRVLNVTELSKSREAKLATVVSDGSRLYFAGNFGGANRAAQVSVSGGDVVPLATSLDNVLIFDISPDKSNLLVGKVVPYDWPPRLWILPIVGSAPHAVGEVRAEGATWMPDRQRILYSSGNTVFATDPEGGESRKLLTATGRISGLAWSPDGERLRFDVRGGGNSMAIWEADGDGRRPHPLLAGWNQPPQECCGRWSSDGRYYFFQSTRSGRTDLWALRDQPESQANATPIRLTSGPLSMLSPFPSPDGKKIYAMGRQQVGELVRYDTASRQFVPYLNGISAEGVSSSRDGKWVTYVTYPEGELWRSHTDGSERLQLTEPPFMASVPVFSPDGKQIAFVGSSAENPAWQIYVVSADGGTPRQLTSGNTDLFSPGWSADGSRLIYSAHPWTDTALFMMELRNRTVTTVPGSKGLCCPSMSRDGKYLFAAATSPPRIMMYEFAGEKWSEIWRGVFDYYDFSRDDSYLYFDTVWEYDPAVYRLRIRDRKLEKVASLQNFRRTRGPNGYWFDVAPDDSPLLLRNLSTEQVYELDFDLP